jgi:sialic acid synthase SpsE
MAMPDELKRAGGGVLLIAEIGSNHNGDLDTALRLIDVAAGCGADVCKFQSFLVDDLLAAADPNYVRLRRLQLPREWYPLLMERCREKGVRFLSTATNEVTLRWMEDDGAWGYKVASCNITHIPLLRTLASLGKPLIISTGMAKVQDVLDARRLLTDAGHRQHVFLHCVSKYPAPPVEMCLRNIVALRELLGCAVGLSDHTHGTHVAVASVALGATVVEKHITLDRAGIGMDHEVAVLPDEFTRLCREIREVEQSLVTGFNPDAATMFAMRRSLHYTRDISAGERIRREDIKVIRPEDGLAPRHYEAVLKATTARSVKSQAPVLTQDLEDFDE